MCFYTTQATYSSVHGTANQPKNTFNPESIFMKKKIILRKKYFLRFLMGTVFGPTATE